MFLQLSYESLLVHHQIRWPLDRLILLRVTLPSMKVHTEIVQSFKVVLLWINALSNALNIGINRNNGM